MGFVDYDEARRRAAASAQGIPGRHEHPVVALRSLRGVDRAQWELRLSAIRYAREMGATWGDIGRALGVSRQAARQRYARHMPPSNGGGTPVMVGGETHWT